MQFSFLILFADANGSSLLLSKYIFVVCSLNFSKLKFRHYILNENRLRDGVAFDSVALFETPTLIEGEKNFPAPNPNEL